MIPNPYETPRASESGQSRLDSFQSFGIDRTWRVDLAQRQHKVQLKHAYWSGSVTVKVDEEVVYRRGTKLLDWGLKFKFTVDDTMFTLRITPSWLPFFYELLVEEPLSLVEVQASAANLR